MSIPKEPRQLMINLMYIVLTAMLALNVSAEIFNAFRQVNKGLESSIKSLDESNKKLPAQIKELSAKNSEKFGHYAEQAPLVRQASKELTDEVDRIWQLIVDDTGGWDEEAGHWKGAKNYDATTRILVTNKDKNGDKLEQMIRDYRQKFINFFDEDQRAAKASTIPLQIDESYKNSEKPTWAAFNFDHMPMTAVMPLLTKIKNDTKASEAAVLNEYLNIIGGGKEIVFDSYRVVSAAKKSYVIQGDKYESEIFLSAASTNVSGVSITVGGSKIPVKDGVGTYTTTANGLGVKKYTAKVYMPNPIEGGEPIQESQDFEYEVGLRSCNVSADKMNVFYIGVDNPVSVSAAGISSNQLKVTASGCTINKKGKGYVVTASRPNKDAYIQVSGGGLKATRFPFRVKRIPDPIAMIGTDKSTTMKSGTFKAQPGIRAVLENFDFEARCKIQGFNLGYVAKRQDFVEASNPGGSFSGKAKNLKSKAKPGDVYYFEKIKAKCPGDQIGRTLPSLVMKIN